MREKASFYENDVSVHFVNLKSEVYLSCNGATGPGRATHHHGLIGPFGHMTLLPYAQQCSEACHADCAQKVGQLPINQLWINLQQTGGDITTAN